MSPTTIPLNDANIGIKLDFVCLLKIFKLYLCMSSVICDCQH